MDIADLVISYRRCNNS